MPWTFEQAWRRVLLYVPALPTFLARDFVQQAYGRASEMRPWAWLRKDLLLTTLASRTIAITVTNGSLAITSAALFVASDAGRQLKVGALPIYTIDTVTDASNAVLLETYAGASGAVDVTIFDAYLTMPADFGRFLTIVDPSNRRQIPFWLSDEYLNAIDPHRTHSGDPARALVSKGLSRRAATLGQVQYEWWPQPSAARTYPARYFTRPQTLADADTFKGVLAERGDVLITGALAEAARWPGTTERPNAYFNLQNHRMLVEQFRADLLSLELRDDDVFPMDLPQMPWHEYGAWAAYDTDLLRSTDATLAAYY